MLATATMAIIRLTTERVNFVLSLVEKADAAIAKRPGVHFFSSARTIPRPADDPRTGRLKGSRTPCGGLGS